MLDGADDRSSDYDARVVRAFFKDGRLIAIPAQRKKKDVVLRHLVELCFAPGRDYPEKEVNELLGAYHEDFAALRRFMIVEGMLSRDRGVYRRER
jgi:ArsR family transcriptional regulator, arsenate/arsenite/antimonite-responsive transcriptional repressor